MIMNIREITDFPLTIKKLNVNMVKKKGADCSSSDAFLGESVAVICYPNGPILSWPWPQPPGPTATAPDLATTWPHPIPLFHRIALDHIESLSPSSVQEG